jgi:hypothetical protein
MAAWNLVSPLDACRHAAGATPGELDGELPGRPHTTPVLARRRWY